MSRSYFIKTFGCQMNEYDSARMADVLNAGAALVATEDPREADVLLMNTCSVREKAQEKVFSLLGEWRPLTTPPPPAHVGVGGGGAGAGRARSRGGDAPRPERQRVLGCDGRRRARRPRDADSPRGARARHRAHPLHHLASARVQRQPDRGVRQRAAARQSPAPAGA